MKTKVVASKKETKDVEQENSSSSSSPCPFDFNVCREALVALKQLITTAQHGHKQLLDETTPISLYVHVHKIPRCTYLRFVAQLPHPFFQQEQQTRDVCLFVRDDDVNGREYESTIRRYKSMIEQFKLPFNIDIMTLKQLNQELVPYEAKRKLCARYDLFLADRRIVTSLMRGQLLGKHFRHHDKMPLGINVFNPDFKQRLLALCSSTFGRLSGAGPLLSMEFTSVKQSIDDGLANLACICDAIGKQLPGSWSNVHHAYVYGNNLQSLPIYYSSHKKNDVKQINLPISSTQETTQIGELSTISGNLNVIVGPNGTVRLTRKKQLSNRTLKNTKKKPTIKRLQTRTWLPKGNTSRTKISKKKKSKVIKEDEPILNTDGKSLIDTAFVQRIAETKLVEKKKKPKHVEQDFATKPAPRAEKRKRLLAAAKEASRETDDAPMLVNSEEHKIKSGGRSKKKVSRNAV